MRPLVLLPYYFHWHYSQAIKNIFAVTKNLVWFFWHFFSIGLLTSTLFLPWQKIHEERPDGIDFGPIFSTWIINGLMRMSGAIIRLFIIAIGLGSIAATLIGAVFFLLFWFFFPVIVVGSFLLGFVMLFRHS